MNIYWHDLNKITQEKYLEYYGQKHADWNSISVDEAKQKLKEVLRKADPLVTLPTVSYEQTRSNTSKSV